MDFNEDGTYKYDPTSWAIDGAAGVSASRSAVLISGGGILTPNGAREYARRVLAAADDADRQAGRQVAA